MQHGTSPTDDRSVVAARGEDLAAEFLAESGWDIVERNWSHRIGEIDIIASRPIEWDEKDALQLAIIEVKAARTDQRIKPERHVDHRKRGRLVRLARLYLAEADLERVCLRFDVIGVTLDTEEVRHYPAAFDGRGRLRA